MPFLHGVYVEERATQPIAPKAGPSAIQLIVGASPVNLTVDPTAYVNKPLVINTFAEAQELLGYSDSFQEGEYTIGQALNASFRVYNVTPLVIVNVLDPATHFTAVTDETNAFVGDEFTIEEEGILLDANFVVKTVTTGTPIFVLGADYTVEFTTEGYVTVKAVAGGDLDPAPASVDVDYNQLDPSAITSADIIGAFTEATNTYTGLENIEQVYPQFNINIGQIVIPGWSHIPAVAAAMKLKTSGVNGSYQAQALLDIDSSSSGADNVGEVAQWKIDNDYRGKHDIVCWPKVKRSTDIYYMSVFQAALTATTDINNGGVPSVSPSNKQLLIDASVLDDGTEIFLTQLQANTLNAAGVVVPAKLQGWKSWGNYTGAFPESADPKDIFIPIRRMYDWWSNSFINIYFERVDNPLNRRFIEDLIDAENIRANGFKARNQVADATLEFRAEDNPIEDLQNGIVRFRQNLTPYAPAQTIINTLEFDTSALAAALEV